MEKALHLLEFVCWLDERAKQKITNQDKHPSVLTLQAEYQSIYDEIVQPDQVIVVTGYFLRYIPLLGLEFAWLYIGFRQAAYEAGSAKNPGKKFGAPSKKVARYSGMSLRTSWRWVGKPDIWIRLAGPALFGEHSDRLHCLPECDRSQPLV